MKKGPRHLFLRGTLADELEREPCAELNRALPELRVGRVVVAGSRSYDSGAAVPDTVAWNVEIRVIQTIQSIEANLKISSFVRQRELEVLAKREIDVLDAGCLQNVAAGIAEMTRRRNRPCRIGAAYREVRPVKQSRAGVKPIIDVLVRDVRVTDQVRIQDSRPTVRLSKFQAGWWRQPLE